MRKRKISFETLGCRYNRLESSEMAYELEQAGYALAPSSGDSDVVVINTCSVTSKSAARCRVAVRKAKDANPKALIVVAGCYSETNPDEAIKLPGVDIVLDNLSKFDVAQALKKLNGISPLHIIKKEKRESLEVRPITKMEGRTNAYLNIQSGCGEDCSFCIVKVARGKNRSASSTDIVTQVKRLSESGIKEVALSGINIGEFGKGGKDNLARLVMRILDETDIPRVRLSSINPNNVTDELIDLMASSPRFCRHLHIPLQSGSDSVLKRMNRPYSADMYEDLLNRLAERVPGIGLGADVMAGFPSETENEFHETFNLIERSPLMMLHVFSYSPRKGTEAYIMQNNVSKEIKKKRSALLKGLSIEKNKNMRGRFVGKNMNVLIENKRGKDGFLKGFSDNYLPVALKGPDKIRNEIVSVKILSDSGERLIGEPA
ncbi:tRNA t(6)A37-methylthiotransferase [hydrothermal vent metagenome]|uniref:tRNA (N(6)-L-threonylcarbamoyladenosine(37)-C(2))-methylthiotransferase n=1 Tax=hydrothermal vent metagenome TaxID=652676 RepID=A0A3B1CTQ5_9ZZZZ